MKKHCTLLLIICLTVWLSACGWRLRGAETVTSLADNSVYLSGQVSETYTLINNQLQNKNAITSLSTAQYHLILERENWKRRSASVNRDTTTAEFELTLTINYRVLNTAQAVIKPRATARVTRSYTFDQNDIAGKDKEEALIRQDIRRATARQILQQLQLLQR